MLTRKGQDLPAVIALVVMLVVASTVALLRTSVSQQPIDPTLNPSPFGYTLSLVLFVVPCVVFGVRLVGSPRAIEPRRACRLTLLLLLPPGFILDSAGEAIEAMMWALRLKWWRPNQAR